MLDRNDRGFILVAVIWLAGLIAAAAAGFALKVRLDMLQSAAQIRAVEAELAADGLARLTAFRLAASRDMPHDSTAVACRWNARMRAVMTVQDQSGLIDLNQVPSTIMQELVRRLGLPEASARQFTRAFEDYRDADSQDATGAPEPVTYPGRDYGPKNAPFQAIEELDQIPGLDDATYRKLLPLVTVYATDMPGVAPDVAPAALRQIMGENARGDFHGPLLQFSGATQGKSFGIDIQVETTAGARFRRQAIAILLRQPDKPFVFIEWKKGHPRDTAGFAASGNAPPCFN